MLPPSELPLSEGGNSFRELSFGESNEGKLTNDLPDQVRGNVGQSGGHCVGFCCRRGDLTVVSRFVFRFVVANPHKELEPGVLQRISRPAEMCGLA